MHGGNRYNPFEHASRTGVAIEWCANCLQPDQDHTYVADYDTLILREGLPADRLNLAAAVGLAERDLHRGEALDGITDPLTIAAHRLIPLPYLHALMAHYRGGITAVAEALEVPPTLVRLRLDNLCNRDRDDLQTALAAAKATDPRYIIRHPLRATVHAARAVSGAVASLLRRAEPDGQASTEDRSSTPR